MKCSHGDSGVQFLGITNDDGLVRAVLEEDRHIYHVVTGDGVELFRYRVVGTDGCAYYKLPIDALSAYL